MTSHFGAQIFRVALKHDPMGYAYDPAPLELTDNGISLQGR